MSDQTEFDHNRSQFIKIMDNLEQQAANSGDTGSKDPTTERLPNDLCTKRYSRATLKFTIRSKGRPSETSIIDTKRSASADANKEIINLKIRFDSELASVA